MQFGISLSTLSTSLQNWIVGEGGGREGGEREGDLNISQFPICGIVRGRGVEVEAAR